MITFVYNKIKAYIYIKFHVKNNKMVNVVINANILKIDTCYLKLTIWLWLTWLINPKYLKNQLLYNDILFIENYAKNDFQPSLYILYVYICKYKHVTKKESNKKKYESKKL